VIMIQFKQLIQGLNVRPTIGAFGYASVVLITDKEENILFDTGGYGVRSYIKKLLEEIKIDKVFISHLHFDHCSNMDLFPDTPIYIHQHEVDFLNSSEVQKDIDTFLPVKEYLKKLNIQTFISEQNISKQVKIIPTIGHTIGHSSLGFEFENNKAILAGDALKTYQDFLQEEYVQNAYNKEWAKKSKDFIKDNFNIIIPGHSGIIKDGNILDAKINLTYF
jgi:N-acyl homoserine lactone hydrolase